ncbi:hypothetical protein [Shewanella sp. 0m-4]
MRYIRRLWHKYIQWCDRMGLTLENRRCCAPLLSEPELPRTTKPVSKSCGSAKVEAKVVVNGKPLKQVPLPPAQLTPAQLSTVQSESKTEHDKQQLHGVYQQSADNVSELKR